MNRSLWTEAASQRYLWRNGELCPWDEATVHVTAVGHASVPAVFEGIRAYRAIDGRGLLLFRLREHLQRFHESARLVRLALAFDVDELCAATCDLLRTNTIGFDAYVRPWAFVSGIVREAISPAWAPSEVVIDTWESPSNLLTGRTCRAGTSTWRHISDTILPPRAKAFSNYHNARLATMESRQNGYDWPVMLSGSGHVTEGPGACVGLIRDGTLVTPPVSEGILDSLTRATTIELADRALDMHVEVRPVERTELYLADEAFFMGTAWEILPIVDVDGYIVGSGSQGPVTKAIERAYHDLVRGASSASHRYLTRVA